MEPTETPAPAEDDGFEWMIVEVYGHRRHGGRVREEDRFGAKMMRIDVPTVLLEPAEPGATAIGVKDTTWVTHWYGGSAIFSFVLTDEATIMRMNRKYAEPQRYIAPPRGSDDAEFGMREHRDNYDDPDDNEEHP